MEVRFFYDLCELDRGVLDGDFGRVERADLDIDCYGGFVGREAMVGAVVYIDGQCVFGVLERFECDGGVEGCFILVAVEIVVVVASDRTSGY